MVTAVRDQGPVNEDSALQCAKLLLAQTKCCHDMFPLTWMIRELSLTIRPNAVLAPVTTSHYHKSIYFFFIAFTNLSLIEIVP